MNNNHASIMAISAVAFGLALATFGVTLRPAMAHDCPEEGCITDGRMTGGGRLNTDMIVTHGFELHCSTEDTPNNLQINWDGGNRFHLDELIDVKCLDSPLVDSPSPPAADFDLLEAHGTGSYNGVDGATIYFVFTDAGEPGRQDTARIKIEDAGGNVVLDEGTTNLRGGNHQAH
ncbi:MAG: hypothetical protein ACREAW_02015 [Nitrososphaera sp.]